MVMTGCCLHFMGLVPINGDVTASEMFLEYNHPNKQLMVICMDGLTNPLGGSD